MEILLINTRLCLEIQRVVNGQEYFIPKIERYIKRHELATDNLNRLGAHTLYGNLQEANQINNMSRFLHSLYVKYNSKNDILKADGNKWERIDSLVLFSNVENFTDVIQDFFNDFKKHFENKMLDNSVEVFAKRQLSPVIELLKQFDAMLLNHKETLMTIHHCLEYDKNTPNTSNSFSWYLYTIELVVKLTKDLIYRHYPELEETTERQKDEKPKEEQEFTFANKFDNIDPKDVYSHFEAGLVDKKYINKETLREFLNRAFNEHEEGKVPKTKLRMDNVTNNIGRIRSVFYKYYKKQVSKHEKKTKYVKLLSDNFIDFEYEKTYNNFE